MWRVLFVIGSTEVGGAEGQLVLLAEGLHRLGHEVHVYTLEKAGPLSQRLAAAGVHFSSGGYDRKRARPVKLAQLLASEIGLLRLMRRLRPDVVQAFLPLANFSAAIMGRLAGAELIVTSKRALGTHLERVPWWRPFEGVANRLSDVIVANSEAVKQDAVRRERLAPDRLRVIFNGLEAGCFSRPSTDRAELRQREGVGPEDFLILCVGNLIPYKGHLDLIAALGLLGALATRVQLLIAGEDRGAGERLRARARELGLEARLHLLGRRSDIPELLAAADLFALPSHEEGFSNALLEAMAAGRPILATAVGGNAEALDAGRCGKLVPPRDPAALAAAIGELLQNESARMAMGTAARERARARYGVAAMVAAHLELYGMEA